MFQEEGGGGVERWSLSTCNMFKTTEILCSGGYTKICGLM